MKKTKIKNKTEKIEIKNRKTDENRPRDTKPARSPIKIF
jgi:hypothetical protein